MTYNVFGGTLNLAQSCVSRDVICCCSDESASERVNSVADVVCWQQRTHGHVHPDSEVRQILSPPAATSKARHHPMTAHVHDVAVSPGMSVCRHCVLAAC